MYLSYEDETEQTPWLPEMEPENDFKKKKKMSLTECCEVKREKCQQRRQGIRRWMETLMGRLKNGK